MLCVGNFKHQQNFSLEQIERVEINGNRYYQTPVGVFPSVTSVTGWEKRNEFARWRRDNPEESERVCSRGTNLHKIIENYLNNDQVAIEQDSKENELFLLMKKEIDKINNIRALETPVWSKTVGLAGRVDCIAEYKKELCVIDFKGSTRSKRKEDIENYFLQACAYSLMWQELSGEKCNKLCIIMGSETGLCQVFLENTIDYVKKLHNCIKTYKKYNEFPAIR